MKAECHIEKIKEAIIASERVTGKNLTLPILSSVLILASNKSLKFRATNLSLGIDIEVPAKIEKEGVVAVRGDVLLNLFAYIPNNQNVVLEEKDGVLLITTKNSSASVKIFPYEDFPTIPTVSDGQMIEIPAKKLIEGLKGVYYASAISDIKPEISSVYLYSDDDMLVFVATDSFRLSEKKVRIKGLYDFPNLLIPYKNVVEIIKIFENTSDTIKLFITKNQIAITSGSIYLTSRIIDGVFPDYKQIVAKTFTTNVTVLKQDLLHALKITNIFSDKFNQINFIVEPTKKIFQLESKNTDIGETVTHIDASAQGESVAVSINQKYITDCFQSITADSLTVGFNGAGKAVVLRGVGDDTFMYLVMPMNK